MEYWIKFMGKDITHVFIKKTLNCYETECKENLCLDVFGYEVINVNEENKTCEIIKKEE